MHTVNTFDATYHKGDILIYSAHDNSIPYELMVAVEGFLNAERIHLG